MSQFYCDWMARWAFRAICREDAEGAVIALVIGVVALAIAGLGVYLWGKERK